jgi:hypothetical protein
MGQTVETSCDGCGDTASYQLPPQATHYAPGIVGVISHEERVDKKSAKLEAVAGGPITLKCAECGGNLPGTRERIITCPYCEAASLIPSRAMLREPGAPIEPDIWWLAFQGRSDARALVETPALEGEKGGLKKIAGGMETYLEEAPLRPVTNTKQWMLTLLLPSIAMLVGAAVYLIASVLF